MQRIESELKRKKTTARKRPDRKIPSRSMTDDVLGLQAFGSGLEFELDRDALIERFIAVHLNRGIVDEDVFTR